MNGGLGNDDDVSGSDGADRVAGYDGADRVCGGNGRDLLVGGAVPTSVCGRRGGRRRHRQHR